MVEQYLFKRFSDLSEVIKKTTHFFVILSGLFTLKLTTQRHLITIKFEHQLTILESILIDKIGLTFEEFSVVNPFVQKRLLKKKELIIKAGDTCSFIGFLESGTLRSYVLKNGAEFNVDFYFPGSIVSAYTSFLEQKPTDGFIQTISESVLYTLPYSDFQILLKQDTRYYKIARYIAETLFIKKCKREKSLLMDSANERYKYLLGLYPTIEQDVPQYHIASYLGIKPESLSRIKSLTYINEKDGS